MKILATGRLPEEVMSLLTKDHQVEANPQDRPMERSAIIRSLSDKEGLIATITDPIDGELMDLAPNLKMIANLAVGYDNIDLEAATARKIAVSNTPGVLTDASADVTFALILSVARRVVEGDKRVRAGQYKYFAPFLFLGTEVTGKTLGLVGMGGIGKAVAKRARGFDMRVLYHNRRRMDPEEEKKLGVAYTSFEDLLDQSDFVSLHVPLSNETRHLVGQQQLEAMKPTAYLINTARGPVVDESALVEALRKKTIAGAGLDVFENEPALTPGLTDLENAVLLPHVGSATLETRTRMATMAAENLLAGLKGDRPPNCLNWDKIPRDT